MSLATKCAPDTLYDIFLIAVLTGDRSPSKHQAPLNVSQTCRSWRHIAISSPLLWTFLRLELFNDDEHCGVKYPNISADTESEYKKGIVPLTLWLNRSGTSPLSFCLKERMPVDEFSRLLLEQQGRWKDIDIQWNRDRLQTPSLEVKNLHSLRRLSIAYWSEKWGNEDRYKDESQSAPQPLYPDISRPVLLFPLLTGDAIAPQMTSLKITQLTGLPETPREVLVPMLQHCPNLEELYVHFHPGFELDFYDFWYRCDMSPDPYSYQVPFQLDDVRGPLVHLRRLTSLSFFCNNSPHTNVLAHLRVPALQHLEIGYSKWDQFNENRAVVDDICEMLDESSSSLKILVVRVTLSAVEWNLLLKSAPDIERLEYPTFCARVPQDIVLSILNPLHNGTTKCETELKNLKYLKGDLLALCSFKEMVRLLRRYFDNGGTAVVQMKLENSEWLWNRKMKVIKNGTALRKLVKDGLVEIVYIEG